MTVSPQRSAREVLTRAMTTAATELESFEGGIRVNAFDALHQARTRVRRLRSMLSVYSQVFGGSERRAMRARLSQLGVRLGTARDDEVRVAALRERLESADDATAPALRRLVIDAESRAARSRADVLATLDSAAHRALLADLRTFVGRASVGPGADGPITALARHALRRGARAVGRDAKSAASSGSLEDLHELRKAARRVRYAAEAVQADVPGASELAVAAEAVQDALGDHRDAMLLADELRSWSRRAHGGSAGPMVELADTIERDAGARLSDLGELVAAVRRASAGVGRAQGPRP